MASGKRLVSIEELEVGDLIEVRWLDASEAKMSLSVPEREFDTPVRSIGVFGGLRGSRAKHIIIIKEEFTIGDAKEYHYNAIPLGMVDRIVLARRRFWKKRDVKRAMRLLDGLGERAEVDVRKMARRSPRGLAEDLLKLSLDGLLALRDFWLKEVR